MSLESGPKQLKLLPSEIKQHLPRSGLYYFGIKCKHERCSYDIMNCDVCIAYSIQVESDRLNGVPTNEDIEGTDYKQMIREMIAAKMKQLNTKDEFQNL